MAAFKGIAAALMLFFATGAFAADRAIIVLDASGSMWGQIDGKAKLEIARDTLKTVLQTVPQDMELGLMAYGHREKGSCSDIELVVPPAPGSGGAISAAADKMKFLGKTPLSAAVKQAAEDLKYTEDKATVILITDGLETCNADPCAVGNELEKAGVDFTAHVVGFGLTAEEGRQVACLAENTGGKYIQASDADTLKDALVQTVVAEPAPAPQPAPAPEPAAPEFNLIPRVSLVEGGPDLPADAGNTWFVHRANADGSQGEYVSTDYGAWKGNLSAGDYILTARQGHAEQSQPVKIAAGEVARPHFTLNAGTLVIRARPSEGADIASGAAINVKYPGGETTYYGEMKMVFPAGQNVVTVKVGEGVVSETFDLKAGETIERDMIAGVGQLVANASYAPGMKVDASGLSVEILKAQKKIDGTREKVTYGFGPDSKYDLPPGDYVLWAKLDAAEAEMPFSVAVAANVAVDVVLNAGVLAVSAPGAKEVRIYGAAKDIQGERKQAWYAYDQQLQVTMPAGDFVIVATRGDDNVQTETPVTVKAGERTEVTAN
ncbi:MAG: VWA domain-containing protein [Mesorhizobium sp.]|nr:VWA domain-containing protein [Mesorhizobium sp.]MBL8580091.1 VWA domain-containing protein [Mesorhizobium sp.]